MIKAILHKIKITNLLPKWITNKLKMNSRWANDNKLKTLFEIQLNDLKHGNFPTTVNLTDFVSMKNSVLTRNPLIDINFLPIINAKIEQKFFNGFDRVL